MNLRCKVCGEKAAGFHFGAFTCEGCKSFFGRCCNNMSIIGECRNNKECIIDKKNRTSCKACRLQKCLLVGMSKSGSRYGRRSNWFKQYFQENEHQNKKKESHHNENFPVFVTPKTDAYRSAFTEISSQKKTFDLCPTQPLISSHLYLNYFPHLGLNRLVSCKQAIGDNTILLPNTVPFSLLKNETQMNDYFDRLLITKYDNAIMQDVLSGENPLDLSQKGSDKEQEVKQSSPEMDNEFSKKTLPLDLSVK